MTTQRKKIENHNCIKSGFERVERLLGPSKLKQALLERKNYIMRQNSKAIDLLWTQPIQGSQSLKKYRQHVNPKWQDVTCPEPIEHQLKAYQSDTVAKTEKRKRKQEQRKDITMKLKKSTW